MVPQQEGSVGSECNKRGHDMSSGRRTANDDATALSPTVLAALASGRKLDAVKALRSETGLSLTDAVERIEVHIASIPALAAEFARQQEAMRGKLRGALVMAVALVALAAWIVLA